MSETRTFNAFRNIIWGYCNKTLILVISFLVRTVFIYQLGAVYLGLNGLFTSILQMLSLAELGFGSAISYSMYKPLAEHDAATIRALLRFFRKAYRVIGSAILAGGLLCMPFLPVLIRNESELTVNVYAVYLISLVNAVLGYFLYGYKEVLLTSSQRTDILTNISSVVQLLAGVLSIVILCIFRDYYAYCMITPCVTVFNNLCVKQITDQRFSEYAGEADDLSPEIKESIRERVKGIFIYKICVTFRNSFDAIVISAFLGLVLLGKYQNYYTILNGVTGILKILTDSITAGIGNSLVTETEEKNYRDFQKIQLMYMWLSGICTVLLLCLYQPFMKAWIGEEYLLPDQVMVIFCIYFYVLRMGTICVTYRHAAGLWWKEKYRSVTEAALNLILNLACVQRFGIAGVLIATIISMTSVTTFWGAHIMYRNCFPHERYREYIGKLLRYMLPALIAGAISWYLCSLVVIEKLALVILVRGVISIGISNIILWIFLHDLPEYAAGKGFLLRLWKMRVGRWNNMR